MRVFRAPLDFKPDCSSNSDIHWSVHPLCPLYSAVDLPLLSTLMSFVVRNWVSTRMGICVDIAGKAKKQNRVVFQTNTSD